MTADYHLHTPLCRHAVGEPWEYAQVALAKGLPEIGFADHSPMPEPFDDWRMLLEDLPRYLEAVQLAREKFPQLTIRLGLEVDYLEGHEAWIDQLAGLADWDYLIGSVHYIAPGWDVDNPKWIGRFRDGDVSEIWAMYWRVYEKAIRSQLFDFVGHPDLPKKFGFRPPGDLRPFYEPSINALAETGTAFEINTAGLRKEVHELYPAAQFLEMAHAAGVPLLINSDAHAPEEVGADFPAAIQLAKNVGYREVVRFQQRTRRTVPL
jgi:histidinol-phosphatase (PHP family)